MLWDNRSDEFAGQTKLRKEQWEEADRHFGVWKPKEIREKEQEHLKRKCFYMEKWYNCKRKRWVELSKPPPSGKDNKDKKEKKSKLLCVMQSLVMYNAITFNKL